MCCVGYHLCSISLFTLSSIHTTYWVAGTNCCAGVVSPTVHGRFPLLRCRIHSLMAVTYAEAFPIYRASSGRSIPYLNFHLLQIRKVAFRGKLILVTPPIPLLLIVTSHHRCIPRFFLGSH